MRHPPAIVVSLLLLSGCFTGPRPSVTTEPFPAGSTTGDPAIDKVLTQLDVANDGTYTADYSVLTKFGNTTRQASVAITMGRRSVTVGEVRFLTDNRASQTCFLNKTDPCSSTIDPARISDVQITPDFYGIDAAKRLRRSAVARIGAPVEHTEQIAGQMATCVDVPLPGGTSVFCTLANGPLARLDDGATSINLTQYAPAIDETLFTTS
ncbi:MAG: hypothetical protein ABI949_08510 [Ilumatobacteraceae bacterium]